MCGRFVGFSTIGEIETHFAVDRRQLEDLRPSYNVAPTQQIAVVREEDGDRVLEKMHWGLVPFWADDTSIGNRMINARSETAAEKPAFKAAFKKRRCLIVNDGFFEWTGPKGDRRPVFIRPAGRTGPFAFAGLWEIWRPKDTPEAEPMKSCTILTADAAASIRKIHHRMPVMVTPEAYETWLDPAGIGQADFKRLLSDRTYRDFETHPVDKAANSPENDDPSLLGRILRVSERFSDKRSKDPF